MNHGGFVDLSKHFGDNGPTGTSDRALDTLKPEECVMKIVNGVVKCLREDSAHQGFPHAPLVGLREDQLLMMVKGAQARGHKF